MHVSYISIFGCGADRDVHMLLNMFSWTVRMSPDGKKYGLLTGEKRKQVKCFHRSMIKHFYCSGFKTNSFFLPSLRIPLYSLFFFYKYSFTFFCFFIDKNTLKCGEFRFSTVKLQKRTEIVSEERKNYESCTLSRG